HVHADDPARQPDSTGGEDAIHPGTAAEVQYDLTHPQLSEGQRVADPGEGLRGLGRQGIDLDSVIAEPLGTLRADRELPLAGWVQGDIDEPLCDHAPNLVRRLVHG